MNLETIMYGALMAVGLFFLYYILRFLLGPGKKDATSPVMSGAACEGCSGEAGVSAPPPESLVPPEKATAIVTETLPFEYPPAVHFWRRAVLDRETGEPYRSITAELLTILCDEGANVSSVASRFQSAQSSNYSRVGKTSLLDHSLHVAQQFCNGGYASYTTTLGVIASLGHDLGKLPSRRTDRYSSCRHPGLSVHIVRPLLEKYLDRPAGLPSLDRTELKEILEAIERHHENSVGLLSPKLREADMAARRAEEIAGALQDKAQA